MCDVTFPSPPLRPLQEYTNTKAMESTLKSLKYSLKKSFRCGTKGQDARVMR